MPSLSADCARHTVIARQPGHYLCFPDICRTASGRLLVAYRETDQHVANRAKLLLRESLDQGRTWSEPMILAADCGDVPRMSLLSDGEILLVDDGPPRLYRSQDQGRSWAFYALPAVTHGVPDRVLELDFHTLLFTGHIHRGAFPQPTIRQAPSEQMVYRSQNRGATWEALSVMAYERRLVLCEASMIRLPDGRLLALLRENSLCFEPMYACLSTDNGQTWGEPLPTPLIGHRPCLGLTRSGKLLATYRNVAPDMGTAAWLGDLHELIGDDEKGGAYAVHGLTPDPGAPGAPRLDADGLRIENDDAASRVLYCLRPMTDPEQARAVLEVELRVFSADKNHCGLRFCGWWRVFPDRVIPELPGLGDHKPIPLPAGQANTLRLEYDRGALTLSVNGRRRKTFALNPRAADLRPIVFGNAAPDKNAGSSLWRRLSLTLDEPRHLRRYAYTWTPDQGLPDAYAKSRVLELKNDRQAGWGDFGYSGWVELTDNEFLSAYHHGGGDEPGYQRGFSSRIQATRFFAQDFAP